MTPLQFFNTMSRKVEPFTPLDAGRVSMYTCGPTVYNYAHIGNFRTFLFEDLLRRWLDASGYEVFHVMNLTDVDDKTIKGAGEAKQPLQKYVRHYIDAFFEDRDWLRIRPAHAYPRATEFVPRMIELVEGLLAKGVAYVGDDGSTYFSIDKFPAYGRLSQLDRRELKTGASERVSADEYAKEDARDFALWKAAKPDDEAVGAAWDAPFGRGRPGWHLECSAMALDLVGKRFGRDVLDIHCGAVDLIFPHHEDEIAQSCAYTGEPDFARYWLHGEFLQIKGRKMSKRWGNFTTVRDLREDGVDPAAVRLLIYNAHYRQKMDLTDDSLAQAREGSRRLGEFAARLSKADGAGESGEADEIAARMKRAVTEALNDDLNAPRAVAAMFDFVREGNRLLDAGRGGAELAKAWVWANGILDVAAERKSVVLSAPPAAAIATSPPATAIPSGVALSAPPSSAQATSPPASVSATGPSGFLKDPPPGFEEAWAQTLAEARMQAKRERNFKLADEIRDRLKAHGFEIRDTKEGPEVVRTS